jgi:hydroxymethylbilane synthase
MIIIGSRGSALALAQTGWVKDQILSRFPDLEVRIQVISTSADKNQSASIRSGLSVGVFVKELEQALHEKDIDIAVHSMKDVPTAIPPGLQIAAVPEREDPRDAFVSLRARTLAALPAGSIVGTGSIRRQAQLLALRPDLKVAEIRGNVDTRLKKLQQGDCDAIILACAGLKRLGLQDRISSPLDFAQMLPAPGQGALGIEVRSDDLQAFKVTESLNHGPTALAVSAERQFLHHMGGGCNVPVAVYAHFGQDTMEIDALVASPDGREILRDSACQRPESAAETAVLLAERMLSRGARSILEKI